MTIPKRTLRFCRVTGDSGVSVPPTFVAAMCKLALFSSCAIALVEIAARWIGFHSQLTFTWNPQWVSPEMLDVQHMVSFSPGTAEVFSHGKAELIIIGLHCIPLKPFTGILDVSFILKQLQRTLRMSL